MPKDAELVRIAKEGIEHLNQNYSRSRAGAWEAESASIFFLFHRPRRWNAPEGVWMGHERKRGKLAEFNALVRGSGDRFAQVVGDTTVLPEVRYVITLDTDTQLPRDSARKMVGAIAHVLKQMGIVSPSPSYPNPSALHTMIR